MEQERLLHAYLNGTATPEELALLKSVPEYASYIKIAEVTKHFDTPNFDDQATLKAIHEKIGKQPKVRQLNIGATILKVAAVFAVLFAGYFYINSLDTTITTSIAEKKHFTLPDGSEVVLNAGSSIEYNKENWEETRQLELTGEAYFKVTTGKRFTVKTQTGTVSVLGTQFNIFARDAQLNVFCYEGLVSVAFQDTLIKLPGSNGLKLNHGNLITKTQSPVTAPSWIANESSFENATVATVLKELQRQYPVTVNAPKKVLDKRFSGTFTHTDLHLALQLICKPLHLTYKIAENQVTLYAAQEQ